MDQEIPNFDTLLKMAQENPEELEELRVRLANSTINQAPEELRPRLRGLQFQIDTRRKLAKNPMAACIQLSDMMHRSFIELYEVLNNPYEKESLDEKCDAFDSANVLRFPASGT